MKSPAKFHLTAIKNSKSFQKAVQKLAEGHKAESLDSDLSSFRIDFWTSMRKLLSSWIANKQTILSSLIFQILSFLGSVSSDEIR